LPSRPACRERVRGKAPWAASARRLNVERFCLWRHDFVCCWPCRREELFGFAVARKTYERIVSCFCGGRAPILYFRQRGFWVRTAKVMEGSREVSPGVIIGALGSRAVSPVTVSFSLVGADIAVVQVPEFRQLLPGQPWCAEALGNVRLKFAAWRRFEAPLFTTGNS